MKTNVLRRSPSKANAVTDRYVFFINSIIENNWGFRGLESIQEQTNARWFLGLILRRNIHLNHAVHSGIGSGVSDCEAECITARTPS